MQHAMYTFIMHQKPESIKLFILCIAYKRASN